MTNFLSWDDQNIVKQCNFGTLSPYEMEIELQKCGSNLKIYNYEKKTNHEVIYVDNKLMTASFANSGKFVAEKVLKLINKTE